MSWLSRLVNTFRSRRMDEELADEMLDHLERRTAALSDRGLNPNEARRAASLRFGNLTRLHEQSREVRMWPAIESTFQDVRYAWRGMRKSPAFAVTAVLSLALAIGANTAIYSIVDAAMLRPLPVPQPEQLFTLAMPDVLEPGSEPSGERESFSYPLYLKFREAAGNTARLALFSHCLQAEARGPGSSSPTEKITKQFISGEAFDILRVPPALGRLFSDDEDRTPGGHPIAVLSYDYWHRRFNADPAILGQAIQIDGKSYRVSGIAREGFFGIEPGKFIDVWIPAMMYTPKALTNSGWNWFRIVGRLAPGASREQFQARLQPTFHETQVDVVRRFPSMPPAIQKQFREMALRVHSGALGASAFRRTFAQPLWIVFGVAAGLLLIACANVASLLLARSIVRSPELAMRVSLGAGRWRLVRQFLTESLLLSAMAGGLGWLLARLLAPTLMSLLSKESDQVRFVLSMNSRVLLFCVAASTLAAVFFGLLPAWHSVGAPTIQALRASTSQAGKLRLGRFFVGLQVAFAFCLVLAGAAFLFTLWNLISTNPGFDPRSVAVLSLSTEAGGKSKTAQLQLMDELQRRVATQPGVQASAIGMWAIFRGVGWTEQVQIPGKNPSDREEIFYGISPGYFATLGTPLLSGRDFQAQDATATGPVPTIVNEAFVGRYFDGVSPLGREFQRPANKTPVRHVVVGVVADASFADLRKRFEPIVYVPLAGSDTFTLYLRSPLKLDDVVGLVEREVREVGSGMRVREITTLEKLISNTLMREKLLAGIGGVFAFLGLVLAAIGLFGLLNYSVKRRTKEIGIRTALGAGRAEILSIVLKDLLTLVGGGLIAGLAGSLAVMTLFRSLLFGIKRVDPFVIGTAAAVFLAAAIVAGALPARRAAVVDPMIALRHE